MNRHSQKQRGAGYGAWLEYRGLKGEAAQTKYCRVIAPQERDIVMETAVAELAWGLGHLFGQGEAAIVATTGSAGLSSSVAIGLWGDGTIVDELFREMPLPEMGGEGYAIRTDRETGGIAIGAASPVGALYGVFHLLRLLGTGRPVEALELVEHPANQLRMINQWDNMDGSVERGYAGSSIFYENNAFTSDTERLSDYARLLASCGINAISINNVNVHRHETILITPALLPEVAKVAALFRAYGIRLFLSVNYASPLEIGGLATADPLDEGVREWWRSAANGIYAAIPDFGGFVVKADSESRPGPFDYGRDHADGSNMLAEALRPHGGIVIWRCFVYDCKQDWRDRSTDRARAAYDHFKPLDGRFLDNVILQVKNGPLDFQVREPVSPLLGAMERTNQMIEFQIAQEYTGQQRHLCYLVPQWKETLDYDTHLKGEGSTVKRIADGSLHGSRYSGIAAVSNIGSDDNWTGHLLAQANLYGYGRLVWNPELSAEEIAEEWIRLTFGGDERTAAVIGKMLMTSWEIYESYTAPLAVGFMVNPDHHYGPNVDGYEYSKWGTYHFADRQGIGVDRMTHTGTGYTSQYAAPNRELYEALESCPDELLLFFHHVPYTHVLHSGKSVIQHIYDTRFEGAARAEELKKAWDSLAGRIDARLHRQAVERLAEQVEHAKEWRDVINTYFYRKSGIADELGRKIY